jgi:hypothetical protein
MPMDDGQGLAAAQSAHCNGELDVLAAIGKDHVRTRPLSDSPQLNDAPRIQLAPDRQ